jgi:hypothetical protein
LFTFYVGRAVFLMNWDEQISRLFSLFQYFLFSLALPVEMCNPLDGSGREYLLKLSSRHCLMTLHADDRYGVTKANRHAAGFPVGYRQKRRCQLRFKFTNRHSLFLPFFRENRPNDQLMVINYGPPIAPDENRLTFFTERRFRCIFPSN